MDIGLLNNSESNRELKLKQQSHDLRTFSFECFGIPALLPRSPLTGLIFALLVLALYTPGPHLGPPTHPPWSPPRAALALGGSNLSAPASSQLIVNNRRRGKNWTQ